MKIDKKYLKKLEQQKKSNPGNKIKHEPLYRGRSVVFTDKSKYNRNESKKHVRKELQDV